MQVTVYEKAHCQPCRATKRKLDLLEVPYKVISVEENPGVAEELREQGFQQSPVVRVTNGGDTWAWSGYQPDRLTALGTIS